MFGGVENFTGLVMVHLIEVPVDYSENERVLIEELSALTAKL